MQIKYQKNLITLDKILIQYYILFTLFMILLLGFGLNLLKVIGIFICFIVSELLYIQFKIKINKILNWNTRNINADTIIMTGGNSIETSSIIEYVEYNHSGQTKKAKNLESLFLPIVELKDDSIIHKPFKLNEDDFNNLLIYISHDGAKSYFNGNIEYHLKILNKIRIFISTIFLGYFIFMVYRLI